MAIGKMELQDVELAGNTKTEDNKGPKQNYHPLLESY